MKLPLRSWTKSDATNKVILFTRFADVILGSVPAVGFTHGYFCIIPAECITKKYDFPVINSFNFKSI